MHLCLMLAIIATSIQNVNRVNMNIFAVCLLVDSASERIVQRSILCFFAKYMVLISHLK